MEAKKVTIQAEKSRRINKPSAGINSSVNADNFSYNARGADRVAAKNQQIAMTRLARSKWRRDPIKERLLFLTGTGSSQVESPEYVNYLEDILKEKHFEKEASVIKSLASLEKDREWLWRVKKEVDFTALEKASLEQDRAARAAAEVENQDRQGMLLAAPKEITLYTIAARTYGLDANRNVDKMKESHLKKMRENIESGVGYSRYTRLLDLTEQTVDSIKPMIDSKDIRDTYIKAEAVIQDTQTVEEQDEEEMEKENEKKRLQMKADKE